MKNEVFHYPPELLNLLIQTIPKLFRSKDDVLLFFKGAGTPHLILVDLHLQVKRNRDSISKYEIVRTVLTRLNEKDDAFLRERREVLKRVVEFENFEGCWENDRLQAKGLVAEIRQLVNVKDSFTRMRIEKQNETELRKEEYLIRIQEKENKRRELEEIRNELNLLFQMNNPHQRGKELEFILNRLFKVYGILVREAFTLTGDNGEGIVEQIDGVIELDGAIYLVEMKWWNKPLGTNDVSQHLVRVFTRGHARGIFISTSSFTEPAIKICRDALSQATVVLCDLMEIITALEQGTDLVSILKGKIHAAVVDKNPYHVNLIHQ
jgi:restriction system protein